ncbi:MAG TPA: HAMP domain-containing sensor histidine kinase [Enhygromyxa sp.]|nr:HAMP domain-containing sensor histidine kinase [Enhygromyxa sp.]
MSDPSWSRPRSLRYRALGVVLTVSVAPLLLVSWVGTGSSKVSERMLERLALESPEAAQNLRNPLRRLTIVLLPGSTLLAAWLGWRMVRPIERLRDEVRRKEDDVCKAGDLDASRQDELGDLARSFNRLLDQLEARRRQNEVFVADLAHEFKSPVAAIRAAAEALDRPATELDPARLERIARIMRDSGHRLDVLLSQFLELARAEGGMIDAERTHVDVAALARGIAGALGQDPRYAELRVEVEAPDELATLGVASGIESALRNLIDNAASFASARVRVTARRAGEKIVVDVDDDGPGVAAEDAGRVFDRFFTRRRAEPGGKSGTGLGLALVRAVAVAHGGTVEVGEAPLGGARFTLELASR